MHTQQVTIINLQPPITNLQSTFEAGLATYPVILTEGSIYERLRRHPGVRYDAYLAHGGFVYDDEAAVLLAQVHRDYMDVGRRHGLPLIALTDTWRASRSNPS